MSVSTYSTASQAIGSGLHPAATTAIAAIAQLRRTGDISGDTPQDRIRTVQMPSSTGVPAAAHRHRVFSG
jgi:hypothetical protein